MKFIIVLLLLVFRPVLFAQNSTEDQKEDLPVSSNKQVVSGFYNRVNTGVLGGSDASASFNIVNGIVIDDHWSTGFGLGIETFRWNRGYIPAFVEGNYNFLKQKTSPWISALAGYEVPLRNWESVKGGPTLGGKIGFSYFVGKHIGISTSVGGRYTYLRDKPNSDWDDVVIVSHLNRFEIRIGMVFK